MSLRVDRVRGAIPPGGSAAIPADDLSPLVDAHRGGAMPLHVGEAADPAVLPEKRLLYPPPVRTDHGARTDHLAPVIDRIRGPVPEITHTATIPHDRASAAPTHHPASPVHAEGKRAHRGEIAHSPALPPEPAGDTRRGERHVDGASVALSQHAPIDDATHTDDHAVIVDRSRHRRASTERSEITRHPPRTGRRSRRRHRRTAHSRANTEHERSQQNRDGQPLR